MLSRGSCIEVHRDAFSCIDIIKATQSDNVHKSSFVDDKDGNSGGRGGLLLTQCCLLRC